MTENQTDKTDKDLFWVFYGIAVAFIIQALYEAIGLLSNPIVKVITGIVIGVLMLLILTIVSPRFLTTSTSKSKHRD